MKQDQTIKYPVGIQSFAEIRKGNYLYVDKTALIERLKKGKYYFLSRPRRFGKSLLLSTLEAYYQGRRELFRGLALDSLTDDWEPHPVLKFSFNTLDPQSIDSLDTYLSAAILRYEEIYCHSQTCATIPQRFEDLIVNACRSTGKKVVVLIDEYDAPLLSTLERPEFYEQYRTALKAFFSVLKSYDEYIEMAFITGVSRFSHTSLFSGANNLEDITFDSEYATICGITEKELTTRFSTPIRHLAEKLNSTDEDTIKLLKENYDGYHFCQDSPDIYNPFSLMRTFKSRRIDDYWFQSGTPTYLINILKRDDFFLPNLDCQESFISGLSAKESYLNNPVALLYETGYLTIKSYDEEKDLYTLGLPNKEVAVSFTRALLPAYSGYKDYHCDELLIKMRSAIIDGEPDRFMELLKTFMEGNPYSNTELSKRETYFKNNLFLVFRALGFMPRTEQETCRARMDTMLQTRRFIYVFELKTDGNVADAAKQIDDKGYAEPYRHSGKTIFKIAANYSSKLNNIADWSIETISD